MRLQLCLVLWPLLLALGCVDPSADPLEDSVQALGEPLISIASPSGGPVPVGAVRITGTARDLESYVGSVEVRVDGGAYVAATSGPAGGFATWSATVQVPTAGPHKIVARAIDRVGNQGFASLDVTGDDALLLRETFESATLPTAWQLGSAYEGWQVAATGAVTLETDGTRTLTQEANARVSTTASFTGDLDLRYRVKTVSQTAASPAPWQSAWTAWRYSSDGGGRGYYFVLKTNGYELGKFQGDGREYLATGAAPAVTLGAWQTVRITQVGAQITVYVGGAQILSVSDSHSQWPVFGSGGIALYNASARVRFDDVELRRGAASSSPPPSNVLDDFESGTYELANSTTSPNGKWYNVHNGFGAMGVRRNSEGRGVYYAWVKSANDPGVIGSDGQTTLRTYSSLALSSQIVGDMDMTMDMRTVRQVSTRAHNSWEVAWCMWRFVDAWHHYYFMLKTDGFEFGKKDNNDHAERQVFIKSGTSPSAVIGRWYKVRVRQVGPHVSIWVDGTLTVDMDDPTYNATQMAQGKLGLYNEDAEVEFDNVLLQAP